MALLIVVYMQLAPISGVFSSQPPTTLIDWDRGVEGKYIMIVGEW